MPAIVAKVGKILAKMMVTKKGRKGVGRIVIIVLIPFFLILSAITGVSEVSSKHNENVLKVLFLDVKTTTADYPNNADGRAYEKYINSFKTAFSEIDQAYSELGRVSGEYGTMFMKEIFFIKYLEDDGTKIASIDKKAYVNAFVKESVQESIEKPKEETPKKEKKKEEDKEQDKEEAEKEPETITVTTLLSKKDAYVSVGTFFRSTISDDFKKSLTELDKAIIELIKGNANDSGGGLTGSNDMNILVETDSFLSPLNPFSNSGWTGQCTWYCWGRANQLLGLTNLPLGNARDWISQAKANGFSAGQVPSKDSIAVWGGEMQHVAYVEAYDGTTITISEGNYWTSAPWGLPQFASIEEAKQHLHQATYPTLTALQNKQGSAGIFLGFIYLTK